jgi:hypothetical protein
MATIPLIQILTNWIPIGISPWIARNLRTLLHQFASWGSHGLSVEVPIFDGRELLPDMRRAQAAACGSHSLPQMPAAVLPTLSQASHGG